MNYVLVDQGARSEHILCEKCAEIVIDLGEGVMVRGSFTIHNPKCDRCGK